MYRGFKLSLQNEIEGYYEDGLALYSSDKLRIKRKLEEFISPSGILDGSKLEANWFPLINADVFISHAHDNERIAISLAGWLKNFGIRAFVDSCVWGNANDLLRFIDDEHSYNTATGTYNYQIRNRTTSHVHMMLSTALMKMIDRTECLFFINTPDAITTSEVVTQTESPWIYAELSMTEMVRATVPKRILIKESKTFSKADGGEIEMFEHLRIMTHDVNLKHLKSLSRVSLLVWARHAPYRNAEAALDKLYELFPVLDLVKG